MEGVCGGVETESVWNRSSSITELIVEVVPTPSLTGGACGIVRGTCRTSWDGTRSEEVVCGVETEARWNTRSGVAVRVHYIVSFCVVADCTGLKVRIAISTTCAFTTHEF